MWLTDFECLRTQSEYDNSVNIKLFSLQFVNYYSSIIYIAFFKGRLVGRPGAYNMAFGARQEEVNKLSVNEMLPVWKFQYFVKYIIQLFGYCYIHVSG